MCDSTFERVELGDIAERSEGSFVDGPFGSSLKSDEYTEEGVRLIQLQNIGINEWFDANQKFISERKFLSLQRHGTVPGDIAIAKMAEPVARACIVPPVSEQFVVVADCIRLRPDTSRFVPSYIAKAINSPYTRLEAEKKAIGSTRVRINLTTLKTVGCLVPSFERQSKIAEVLDTLDAAIRGTEAVVAKLKAMKQGLLHDLLTRGIDANGDLRPPHTEAPHLYKETSLGWLPKEWDWGKLEDHCSRICVGIVIRPADYYVSEGVPTFRSANVREGQLTGTDLVYISPQSNAMLHKSQVRKGDILTVRTGYPGTSAVVPDEYDGCNCVDILITTPAGSISADFLCRWINSPFGKEQVLNGQGGLAQQHFNVGEMRELIVVEPSIVEQDEISRRLAAAESKLEEELKLLDKLRLQKSGLMDDLLTGRVSAAPLLKEGAAHGA
ncbi:restriction endonuclease subunit S [Neptunicoccus sediminis]|uniref:restriction endonuclease subunit S n=1 Tax=Neptunicoccus sediminis TaxID=1892596 RepID=UPI0008461166|nr:restriction endonuclease subunit S [Neptunicoccus sediminis]